MKNDVFESVRTVLAVREFADRPVPEQAARRIVEAARLTGSSMNLQPWHFVVVTDPALLKELGGRVQTGPYIAQAPIAVVVAAEKGSRFATSDASRAIQSMILTAWDEGIGSNWAGFGDLEGARDLVGVPDTFDVLAVIPFGYPKQDVGKGKKTRKLLAEVASANRFGTPFG